MKRFHFSVRELLLLTTAVAAILALAIQNWPRVWQQEQSEFYRSFDQSRLVAEAFGGLGATETFTSNAIEESWSSRGISQKQFGFWHSASEIDRSELIRELKKRLRAEIEGSGAEITADTSPLSDYGAAAECFSFAYREGEICGVAFLSAEVPEPGSLLVSGIVYEFAGAK